MTNPLRLATRGSDLATTQSSWVARAVEEASGRASELVVVETTGDRKQVGALAEVGNIGLFTKEVQEAVLDGRADFAVHSLKDLPAEQTPGLCCAAIPVREDARDYLLIRREAHAPDAKSELPIRAGGVVGTASARRAAFLAALAPDLHSKVLRGNVPTRVAKLRDGDYDAILLAGAGLRRLGLDLSDLEVLPLEPSLWPCAPGQGALALECRADDRATRDCLAQIHDQATAVAVHVERTLLRRLGGGCGLPLGAFLEGYQDNEYRFFTALGPVADGDLLLRQAEVESDTLEGLADEAFEALMA